MEVFVSHINSQSELITEKFDSASRSVVYIEAARVDKAFIHHVEIKSKERLKSDLKRSSPSIYLTKPACLTVGPLLQKLAVPMTSFAGYYCYEYSLPTEDTSPVPSIESDDELPFVDIHPPVLDSDNNDNERSLFEEGSSSSVERAQMAEEQSNEEEILDMLNGSFAEALLKFNTFKDGNDKLLSFIGQLQDFKGDDLENFLQLLVSEQQTEFNPNVDILDDKNIFDLKDWSVRAENVLRGENINTVKDLREFGPANFLSVRNCGRKTVNEIQEFIQNLSQHDFQEEHISNRPDLSLPIDLSNWPVPLQKEMSSHGIISCNDLMLVSIQTLSGASGFTLKEEHLQFVRDFASRNGFKIREKIMDPLPDFTPEEFVTKIKTVREEFDTVMLDLEAGTSDKVRRRFGVNGHKETLEDIAQDYDITRERVRQIVENVWRRKLSKLRSIKTMTVKLSDIFSSPFHHERASELTSDIGEIKDFFDNQKFYAEVFRKVTSVDVKAIEIDGEIFLANYDQTEVQKFHTEVYNFLVDSIGATEEELLSAVEIEFNQAPKQAKAALNNLLKFCIFKDEDDEKQLFEVRNRNSAGLEAAKVLFDSFEPLSAEEILENIFAQNPGLQADGEINQRNIQNQLGYFKGVYHMSHHTWGTIKHIPLFGEEYNHVVEAIEYFIYNRDETQFHSREVLPHLPNFASERIQDFHVTALIREHNLENYLGRNVFGPEGEERIHLFDVIVEVLKEEGHPLHASQILERVGERRSVNPAMQIQVKPPIVALGGNMFTYHQEVEDISIEKVYESFDEFYRIENIESFNPTNQNVSFSYNQDTQAIDKKRHENYLEGFYLNHQLPLSNEENYELLTKYDEGYSIEELVNFFQRSPKSIVTRLENLGKQIADIDYYFQLPGKRL